MTKDENEKFMEDMQQARVLLAELTVVSNRLYKAAERLVDGGEGDDNGPGLQPAT